LAGFVYVYIYYICIQDVQHSNRLYDFLDASDSYKKRLKGEFICFIQAAACNKKIKKKILIQKLR